MPRAGGRWARVRAPLALLLLAPFFGEYVIGSLTIRELPVIEFLVPLYGGGALLVREVGRRTRSGWPAVLLLGLCFGVLQAGVVDGSLFDPHYEGMDLTAVRVPWLGVSAVFGPAFVVNHALVSMAVPIAVAEAIAPPDLRDQPWLGTVGLVVTALVLVGGALLIGSDQTGPRPATGQVVGALVVAAALAVVAFRLRPVEVRSTEPLPRHLGRLVLGVAFVGFLLYSFVPGTWWGVALGVALLVAAVVGGTALARRGGWTPRTRLAAVTGVGLGAAVMSFQVGAFTGADDAVATVGRVVIGLLAAGVLVLARRQGRSA